MKHFATLCAAAAIAVTAGAASASVVDFESVGDTFIGTPDISDIDGFDWAFSAGGWGIGDPDAAAFYPNGAVNGTNILIASGDRDGETARVTMSSAIGETFEIGSLFAASSNTTLMNSISVIGTMLGGGTVSATLGVDGSFSEYILSGFTNLLSVEFSSVNSGGYNNAGFVLDDIALSAVAPVPLPAALPLLLAGLGGLGVMRRRRKAA